MNEQAESHPILYHCRAGDVFGGQVCVRQRGERAEKGTPLSLESVMRAEGVPVRLMDSGDLGQDEGWNGWG